MRRTLILSAVLIGGLSLAACGDTGSSGRHNAHGDDMPASAPMDHGMGHGDNSPVADGARRIELTASSFDFDPDEITVEAGEDIAIVLTSDDILHDFTIDELDAHVSADADETAEGGFRAGEPGRYTFYCSVVGHRDAGMEGTLIVT